MSMTVLPDLRRVSDQLAAGSIAVNLQSGVRSRPFSLLQMAHWLAGRWAANPDIGSPQSSRGGDGMLPISAKARRVLGYNRLCHCGAAWNSVAAAAELASATGVPKHASTATTLSRTVEVKKCSKQVPNHVQMVSKHKHWNTVGVRSHPLIARRDGAVRRRFAPGDGSSSTNRIQQEFLIAQSVRMDFTGSGK